MDNATKSIIGDQQLLDHLQRLEISITLGARSGTQLTDVQIVDLGKARDAFISLGNAITHLLSIQKDH